MQPSEKERAEFSIGELASEFDVTPRAIRFYEDHGLTLSESRELIDMYEPGRDERPQLKRFLAVLEAHKASLEQQRADIEAQLTELQAFEKKIHRQLKPS